MNRFSLSAALLVTLASVGQTLAQGLPTKQPKMLTIYREQIKVGRAAEHNRFEAGYPAALEKAKSPDYYLAMTSLTGPNEAWYIQPHDTFAAVGESMKRDDKDPVLSAELSRLALADAEYVSANRVLRAVGRPELSVGEYPDMTKMRFFVISTFRIRPGKEQQFEEMSKAYASTMKRGAPNTSYRIYQVVAGDQLPVYLAFSSVQEYGDLDKNMSEGMAAFAKATDEEKALLGKFSEVAESVETNHFRLDPAQSYVSKEVRQKDPEFWMAK